ncbi:polynucleotide 5'-hydroxyl-kinase NOL9-like [Tropilaelaps mercedesae]|uniref:Polynucleotide 5'-hydroxyl-kinase NOL9-like n=1 Tax=Tropilaelaps mercedesae TaxID=418985 RepID=A0A1V9X244_9ACAR|nr:polynucleotide 5'-hydroxyl-kinase NOL9-like [Tropilaelaps mercedesae]
MGKVRVTNGRPQREASLDDDSSTLGINKSRSIASTSAFNVSRAQLPLKRNSQTISAGGRKKKRICRSDATYHRTPVSEEEISAKRFCTERADLDARVDTSTPALLSADRSRTPNGALNPSSLNQAPGFSAKAGWSKGRFSDEGRNGKDSDFIDEESDPDVESENSDVSNEGVARSSSADSDGIAEDVDARRRRNGAPARNNSAGESIELRRRMRNILRSSDVGGDVDHAEAQGGSDDEEEDILSYSSGYSVNSARGDGTVACRQLRLDGGDRLPSGVRLFLHRGSALVALSDLATISFGGSAWLQVVRGSVRVYGIRLGPSDGPVHVESVPGSCLLITNGGPAGHNNNGCQTLHDRMQLMGAGLAVDKARELIQRFPRKTIIVLHRPAGVYRYTSLRPNFHLASDSTPENMWTDCRFYLVPFDGVRPLGSEKRLNDLTANLVKAAGRTTLRIAIIGSRGSGKSTTLRILCNRLIATELATDGDRRTHGENGVHTPVPIFVLDVDPGQTEFTPAACVSLVEVNHLLMGPPGAHQTKPRKSFLLGDSTAGARPEAYVAAVNSLMAYVHKELTFNHILVVNTMGWLNGIGDLLLGTVLDLVKPCKVLATSDDVVFPTMAWPAKEVHIDAPMVRLKPLEGVFTKDLYTKPVKAAEHRRATIVNYFGGLGILNSKTVSLLWNSVALHEVSGLCPPQELLRLINANVVALCRAPEDVIWKSKSDPTLPMLLKELIGVGYESLECFGFAFVRAVDMLRKTIHLVTPETEETVRSANALVHCTGLNLTDYLVLNQNRGTRQGPAPYSTGDCTSQAIREL